MVTANEEPEEMTLLDNLLMTLRQDMNDSKGQSRFYDLFLNTTFYVPNLDKQDLGEDDIALEEGQVMPLIIESEGNDYLMLFDSKERLKTWCPTGVTWVEVPGYVLAATSMPPLHWALNVGTEYSKQFHPDEITWLREIVERCNEEAAPEE